MAKNKNNILYIHGFNGSPNGSTGTFVQNFFDGDAAVIAPQLDLLDFEKTLDEIEAIIRAEDINIIVAHSFGSFYTFALQDETMMKIVINPCMFPSIEIPKLIDDHDDFPEGWVGMFEKLEEEIYSHATGLICQTTFGIFGKDDELFRYENEFEKIYGTRSLRNMVNHMEVPGQHRLPDRSLERGLSKALYYAEVFDPKFRMQESVMPHLTEHYVNVDTSSDKDLIARYKDQVYELLQKAYAPIGGIHGLRNGNELVTESDFWKIDRTNDVINAVAIYTFKRGGRKLQYAGSNGTDYGKQRLFKIIQDDIRLIDRSAWAEVSDALEHTYLKNGATPLPIEAVRALMSDKEIYELTPEDIKGYEGRNKVNDGFHYKRIIGGYPHIKICVSNNEFDPLQ